MMGEPSTLPWRSIAAPRGVGGGSAVDIDEIETQKETAQVQKTGLRIGLTNLRSEASIILKLIVAFPSINNASRNNSYRDSIQYAQRSS